MRLPVVFALALTLPLPGLAEDTAQAPVATAAAPASAAANPALALTGNTSEATEPVDLQKRNEELKNSVQELQNANNALTLELEHIKSLSADEIQLNEENKKLLIQYETAKRENNTLVAENQGLKEQLKQNTFINGAIAVILGMLATMIVQYFAKSKKRSDWA